MRCCLAVFIILLFSSIATRAAIFIVTSNADSGPGTLREALTLAAANGSTVKDFINFNLPDVSEAGRTIILSTGLPNLSSNIEIDGSTQPGTKIGISDAKVILREKEVFGTSFSGFYGTKISNIEIYGIYFTNIFEFGSSSAINIWDSSDIQIGNPGKGNAFGLLDVGLFVLRTNHVKVSSNIFGIDQFTQQPAYTTYNANLRIYACNDVILGGDTYPEGNIFAFGAYDRPSLITGFDANTGGTVPIDKCVVKCNTFGFKTSGGGITGPFEFRSISALTVDNNIYNYGSISHFQDISNMAARGNRTNLDINLLPDPLSTSNMPFYLYNVINALIGGPNPGDENVITNAIFGNYNFPAVYTDNCYNIRLQRNSFSCKTSAESFSANNPKIQLPVVSIRNVINGLITGMATPGAEVEIFSDSQCQLCEPSKYLASVTAGADGSWQYNVNVASSGFTASATLNGRTSLFAKIGFDDTKMVITHPCGDQLGSITGITAVNYTRIEWNNDKGEKVGDKLDVTDLPVGKYSFTAYLSENCSISSPVYELINIKPVINDVAKEVKGSICSQNTGSVTGLQIYNASGFQIESITWLDQDQKIAGNSLNLLNVKSGTYNLVVTVKDGCLATYGPVKIEDETAPTIDQSNALFTDATCDNYDGSIKGLKVSPGSFTYFWTNENSKVFPTNSPDIDNIPPGTYTLNVKYGDCPPVQSTPITILSKNGVSIDFITQSGRSATCNESNGEITGLRAPGATSYAWRSKSGSAVLSDKLDLKGVPAGIYTLTISNATCSKDIDFEIPGFPPTVFTGITYTNTKTCQAFNTGSITVNTDNANEQPLKYRWVNTTGENVGFDKTVQFLPVGTYKLYLTDKNYCENPYSEIYTIGAYPEFKVVTFGTVTNTQCGVGTGGVTATTVTGGTGNYVYQWLDAGNNTIGSQASIDNLAPGAYKLRITDGGCSLAEIPYNITDEAATPPAPFADNVRVYNPGKVTIKVNDPFPTAIYRLYESATSQQPLRDAIGGVFNIDISESRSYYVSLTYGYCESDRTEVQVFVSALKGAIANTFTPNSDGVNDYWVVEGLSTYPDAIVSVFNRYGQAVFQSIGYAKPFDGNHNGKPLPAGVYYYLIDLKNNNRLSGNVTILR